MNISILAFGITRDIMKAAAIDLAVNDNTTVGALKTELAIRYPALKSLHSYMIAVNKTYADDDLILHARDEIAIIPPVSGG